MARETWDELDLPEDVRRMSAAIYGAVCSGTCRDRGRAQLVVAATYAACREAGIPHTVRELSGVSGIRWKTLCRNVRYVMGKLDMPPEQHSVPALIDALAGKLRVGDGCREEAVRVAGGLDGTYLDGKDPMVMAAASMCVAASRGKAAFTRGELAEASGVSAVSIRTRAGEIAAMSGGAA